VVRMVIDFDPHTGQVQVNGPIDNKLLALGLLDLARKAVWEFDPAKAAGILLARGVPPAPGNGGERP
jgi:uncharacterized protein YfeS